MGYKLVVSSGRKEIMKLATIYAVHVLCDTNIGSSSRICFDQRLGHLSSLLQKGAIREERRDFVLEVLHRIVPCIVGNRVENI